MSSLLQSPGRMDRTRGAELFGYLAKFEPDPHNPGRKRRAFGPEFEREKDANGRPVIYRFWRMPVDMLGCWVRFRINGELQAPDLSVPMALEKLPRDAVRLTDEESAAYWAK